MVTLLSHVFPVVSAFFQRAHAPHGLSASILSAEKEIAGCTVVSENVVAAVVVFLTVAMFFLCLLSSAVSRVMPRAVFQGRTLALSGRASGIHVLMGFCFVFTVFKRYCFYALFFSDLAYVFE